MPENIYDVAVIGSGPAGYTAAIRAGQYGLKTAIIEKDPYLGGTCLHVGCIPTKALLFNAELWDHLKDAKEFGIEGVGSRKLNWQAVQERKSKIVNKHAKGLEFLMRKNKVETVKGFGKLTGPAQNGIHTIEVKSEGKATQLKTKNILLATGSEARMIPGLEPGDRVLTNIEILELGTVPKSLVVVGAGAVGVEFASIFRSFDCEVTILEMLPRMVPLEDEDISKELARAYRKRSINFHAGAKVEKVEKTKSGISVTFSVDGKQQKKALLENSPPEDAVQIRGPKAQFPGIAIAELADDQKKLVEKVMHELLAPYRQEDVKEAMGCLKSGGGLDKMHIAFYKDQDIGSDEIWDIWRLEGPTFVWHFRGAPHVHTYVNIASKAPEQKT